MRAAMDRGVIDSLFTYLAQAWVPWALSALILVAAVLIWLDFRWRRLEPLLRGLDEAIAIVEESEGQASFRQRFPQIFQRLAANPVVGETWRAFAPTLAPAPNNDDAMGYTRRPSESFNEALLGSAGVNQRFYGAVPNLLVGAGLLFTFIGLVAALYFASAGVAASNVEVAQRALRDLLAAATFKFVTSIAGLGSSLVFSWREKAQLYRAHSKLAHFCSALEARMIPVTSESMAGAQLVEMRQQTALLRRLTRDLFVRLPEGVEEGIAGEIARAVGPLRDALAEAAPALRRLAEPLTELLAAEIAAARAIAASEARMRADQETPSSPDGAVGGELDPPLTAVLSVRGRLDGAAAVLRRGITELLRQAREPRRAAAAKRLAQLLGSAQKELEGAATAAAELEASLRELRRVVLAGGEPDPRLVTGRMHELVARIDGGVTRAVAQVADAVGELERPAGR
jgi:hypothetical protein